MFFFAKQYYVPTFFVVARLIVNNLQFRIRNSKYFVKPTVRFKFHFRYYTVLNYSIKGFMFK